MDVRSALRRCPPGARHWLTVVAEATAAWTCDRLSMVIQATDEEDSEGETPTEQMALPALRAAGGRNVQVGEPSHGSPIASLSLVSPTGDELDVSVGPDDQFDPFEVINDYNLAEPFDDEIDGTLIRFSDLDPTVEFVASTAAFNCNSFGWVVNASTGDASETRNFIVELLEALDCRQTGT